MQVENTSPQTALRMLAAGWFGNRIGSKVRREAQTLAAVALMLGLYDSEQVRELRAESGQQPTRPPSPQPWADEF